MRLKKWTYLLFAIFMVVSVDACAQKGKASKQVKQREKILEKQKEEKEKAQEKSIEEGKKRHINIQTKATKKRMKRTAKKAAKARGEKKGFFLFRIFKKD